MRYFILLLFFYIKHNEIKRKEKEKKNESPQKLNEIKAKKKRNEKEKWNEFAIYELWFSVIVSYTYSRRLTWNTGHKAKKKHIPVSVQHKNKWFITSFSFSICFNCFYSAHKRKIKKKETKNKSVRELETERKWKNCKGRIKMAMRLLTRMCNSDRRWRLLFWTSLVKVKQIPFTMKFFNERAFGNMSTTNGIYNYPIRWTLSKKKQRHSSKIQTQTHKQNQSKPKQIKRRRWIFLTSTNIHNFVPPTHIMLIASDTLSSAHNFESISNERFLRIRAGRLFPNLCFNWV